MDDDTQYYTGLRSLRRLREDRRHTLGLLGDVIELEALKRKAGKIYLHLLVFPLCSMGTIETGSRALLGLL